MSAAPRAMLTDPAALARNRARARASGAPALFLHEAAMVEIKERLEMVNKTFTAPAVVTGQGAVWDTALPGARVVPDGSILDLEPGAHDLVVHGLALHWAEDPVGQLVQARRALAPGGLFLGICLGGQTLTELRQALAMAEAETRGGLSPRILPMAEIRDLGALLQRAGLVLPVADSVALTASYVDAWALMRDLRAMGEQNALADRPRHFTPKRMLERAVELYGEHFGTPDGRVAATFEMICLTGWSPGAGQPQPLRPGSATARLADALGTRETPLRDKTHD